MATKAAEQLAKALSPPPPPEEQMTVARLADELGVTRQAVHAWLKGDSRPRSEHMAHIEKLTGVPMQDWFVDAADPEPKEGAA